MAQVISFRKSSESDLFDGADAAALDAIHVGASIAQFENILSERIQQAWPDADVRCEDSYWASGFGDDDSDVAYQAQLMAEDLFNDGNIWMVERAAQEAR